MSSPACPLTQTVGSLAQSVLHKNDFGVGQLAVRLTGEVKKYPFVNDLPAKSDPISRPQGNFMAKIISTHRVVS